MTAHGNESGRRGTAGRSRTKEGNVCDIPFLSASNGWGPVERDTSNGEQQPGDGHPITLNGVR